MKLFRKIYLRTVVCVLLLAATLLAYLLWESRRQNLADAAEYERERITGEMERYADQAERWQSETENSRVGSVMMRYFFQDVFGDRGCLYYEGEEVLNNTPYTFDEEEIKAMPQDFVSRYDLSMSGPQKTGNRWLILSYLDFSSYRSDAPVRGYSIVLYRDVTDIYTRTRTLFWRGLLFAVPALLLAALLLYCGIYRALAPLLSLKQAAASIADGSYGSRVPVRGRDEIAELTVSFNQMAEQVEDHLEELTAVNERQRQLLGSLAHELKTPLTAVIGYADTLLTVPLSVENRERALRYIRSEGQRLARLSEKMLELTGLYESGKETLLVQQTPVAELLEKLEALTDFRRREKQVRLEISCEPQGLIWEMDQDLTMSLLMNLVDNACKASPQGSVIEVRACGREISVTDHGTGIPKEELARVTEPFYMVDKARARSAGGVGLGLALCSQIAALHGWKLKLESREGKGTTVRILA